MKLKLGNFQLVTENFQVYMASSCSFSSFQTSQKLTCKQNNALALKFEHLWKRTFFRETLKNIKNLLWLVLPLDPFHLCDPNQLHQTQRGYLCVSLTKLGRSLAIFTVSWLFFGCFIKVAMQQNKPRFGDWKLDLLRKKFVLQAAEERGKCLREEGGTFWEHRWIHSKSLSQKNIRHF